MKIAISGYSGSGKSTLARKLGVLYGVEVLHIDAVQFLPGWGIRPEENQRAVVEDFLDSHDSWVIDGNYSKLSYGRRMEEADVIVQMLFSPWNCLFRVLRRYIYYRGTSRPDMTPGCNEKLDWEFVMWILRDGRRKAAQNRYCAVRTQYPDKTVVIRNQRQLDAFLERCSCYASEADE